MNLYDLTKYMIDNKLFESKEEATEKISVIFMIGSITESQLLDLKEELNKIYNPVTPTTSTTQQTPSPTPVEQPVASVTQKVQEQPQQVTQ